MAQSLNRSPKYVASNTLADEDATWGPVTVLRGDVAAAVAALRDEPGRELQIHGSTTLGRSLLAAGLVDELRLVVAPVIVGAGRRLFEPFAENVGLQLDDVVTTPGGLVVQTYTVEGAARSGTYDPTRHTFADHG